MLHTELRPLIDHAEALMRAKQFNRAIEAWRQVVADPLSPRGARHRLASAYRNNGQFAEAVELLRATLQTIPDYQAANDLLSDILSELAAPVSFRFSPEGAVGLTVDSPRSSLRVGRDGMVKFSGWVFHTSSEQVELTLVLKNGERISLPFNVPRADVVGAFTARGEDAPNLACGFSADVPLRSASHLEVTRDHVAVTVKIIANHVQQAVEGRDGWLFLANDSNRSIDLFTNVLVPNTSVENGWKNFIFDIQSSFPKCRSCFIITPSKESVHPDRHPSRPGPQFIGAHIAQILSTGPIPTHYPIAELRAADQSYYETDTHWSDFGAAVALDAVFEDWGIEIRPSKCLDFEAKLVRGDLGSKVEPMRLSERLVATPPLFASGLTEFRSRETNTGEFFISTNLQAPISSTIIMFGGSSTGHLFSVAKNLFRHVFRANSPSHMPVREIMDILKPDFLIVQANERYLMKPPSASSVKGTKLGRSLSNEYSEEDLADVYPLRSFLKRHWN